MAFANETNAGRVQRMIETLQLIEVSARSNRAKPAEVAELLAPLLTELRPYAGAPEPAPAPKPPAGDPRAGSHASWGSIREAAERAPLADLTAAMAVFINRFGDHLEWDR